MTGKLTYLRSIEMIDIEILTKWNFDQEISEFFAPRLPNSLEEQKYWLENQFKPTKKKLIIVEKKSDVPIGIVGIMDINHLNKNCEIGITIGDKNYWGKGHAKEAMQIALDFLFNQYNMHIVYLKVFENNKRGINFFEKCGFEKDGLIKDNIFKNGKYISFVMMSLTKENYKN